MVIAGGWKSQKSSNQLEVRFSLNGLYAAAVERQDAGVPGMESIIKQTGDRDTH